MRALGAAAGRWLVALLMFLLAGILAVEAYDIISVIGIDSVTVTAVQPQVYAFRTYSELAEALVLLAPVVLLWGRWKAPFSWRAWRSRLTLTRAWKRACLATAFAGFSIFWILATADVGLGLLGLPYAVGVVGFLSFLAGVLGTFGYRVQEGLGKSLTEAIVFVAAPFLIVFELSIWHFFPIQMSWFATTFARPLAFYEVYLVSNWLILVVSAVLLVLGVASRMARSGGNGETS